MKAELAISGYAAGLSTILAILTLWEKLRRPVPTVTYALSGNPEEGNQIILANPTATPLLIGGWELYWARPKGLALEKTEPLASSYEYDANVFTLAAHGHKQLNFSEGEYFGWGARWAQFGQLYIELDILGRRRSVVLHVYTPDSLDGRVEPWSPRRLLPHGLRPQPRNAKAKSGLERRPVTPEV